MEDSISAAEAAKRIGVSKPTVCKLLETGELEGERVKRKSSFCWRVKPQSVHTFIEARRKGHVKRRSNRLTDLAQQVQELRAAVEAISPGASESPTRLVAERDQLRGEVVSLRESLARMRTSSELATRADAERATVAQHLLAAAAGSERAELLRREAAKELEEALADATRAGNLGELGA
jgi:excisionase family DNA binding protein